MTAKRTALLYGIIVGIAVGIFVLSAHPLLGIWSIPLGILMGGVLIGVRTVHNTRIPTCPTCGGEDREGGMVITDGPDEFGNYDADDCPDEWHR